MVLYGGRLTLLVGFGAVAIGFLIGVPLGALSGYLGGWLDMLTQRVVDVILAFPVLVLYVILIANIGPSVINIVIATTIASAPGIGRITRGLVIGLKQQEYTAAARLRAESTLYIMVVEHLPN